MPRRSSFAITLTRDERATLEQRAAKYTSPYRDVVRAKIILLAADGLRNDIIASRLSLQRQIVSKWRKRFFDQRLAGLEEEPRGGRTARFSSVVVEVKRLACESPRTAGVPLARWSLRELQGEVVTRGVVASIGGTTVWRWLAADAIRRGVIAVGCSRAIPISSRKRAPSSICTPAVGGHAVVAG